MQFLHGNRPKPKRKESKRILTRAAGELRQLRRRGRRPLLGRQHQEDAVNDDEHGLAVEVLPRDFDADLTEGAAGDGDGAYESPILRMGIQR